MKKFLLFFCAALLLMSCSKEAEQNQVVPEGKKQVTFKVDGDWSMTTSDMKGGTKDGNMSANGSSMTDLWIFDYMGETLVNAIHQTPDSADWGSPTVELDYGTHNLYFVASRGQNPTVNHTTKSITFTKVSDTFWKGLNFNVTPTSSSDQSVSLNRIVTKFKASITDPIAEGTAAFYVTPNVWYYGVDYTTGAPTASATDQSIIVNCPSSNIGSTSCYLSVFGFSATTIWHTDVTLQAKNSSGTVLGEVTLEDVPFVRNRSTEFSGPLYGSNGRDTIILNDTWDDPYTGVW